jgi:hypothetical protein
MSFQMLPRLINYICYNVLDFPLSDIEVKGFVKDNALDLDAMLMHPLYKANVVFHAIWKEIYGIHATKLDFYDMITKHGYSFVNPPTTPPLFIEKVLNGLMILKLGLINKKTPQHLKQVIDVTMNSVNNKAFLLQRLHEKFAFRFGAFDTNKNLILEFYERHQYVSEPVRKRTMHENPLSKNVIEITTQFPGDFGYNSEYVQYTITNDIHFLSRVMNHPCIIVLKDAHIDAVTCENISKANHGGSKQINIFSSHAFVEGFRNYQLPNDTILEHIPKLAPWCLVVSSNDSSASLASLALEPKNSILWQQGDNEKAISTSATFDRVFTTNVTPNAYTIMNDPNFWKLHVQHSCPLKTPHPYNNQLLFMDFTAKYMEKHKDKITALRNGEKDFRGFKQNSVIIVDNRPNDASVRALIMTLINLESSEWTCTLYTSKYAYEYYTKEIGDFANVEIFPSLNNEIFDIDVYNDTMTDATLWEAMIEKGIKRCLVIQDDGFIVRPGVDAFLQYDYVGAPWKDTVERQSLKSNGYDLVGNGGLSLRNVSVMYQVCTEFREERRKLFFFNINRVPEDVFFVQHLQKLRSKLPKLDVANAFSSEEIINASSIGFHKVWMYHSADDVKSFFDKILC